MKTLQRVVIPVVSGATGASIAAVAVDVLNWPAWVWLASGPVFGGVVMLASARTVDVLARRRSLTSGGVPLDDAVVARLAAEAEDGYDPSKLHRRRQTGPLA